MTCLKPGAILYSKFELVPTRVLSSRGWSGTGTHAGTGTKDPVQPINGGSWWGGESGGMRLFKIRFVPGDSVRKDVRNLFR